MRARGSGFLYQPKYRDKKSGELKTAATWSIGYSANGKPYRESAGTTDRAEAARLLKKRIADATMGRMVGPQVDRVRLSDLLEMIQNDYVANGRRSLKRIRQAAAHLQEFFGAERRARDISSNLITAYVAQRLQAGAQRATINVELSVLRRGFTLGHKAGKIGTRPEFSMLQVNNARQGFFEHKQFDAVLQHLPDYLQPLAKVAYITGWRTQSELLTRQWRHIDLVEGELRLDPDEAKNREPRVFPFTDELRAILKAQRDHVDVVQRATGQVIPWVFIHHDGTRIRNFKRAWKKACIAAGVPGRLVHDLRRTAVRALERAGVSRSAAMKLTGHKTEAIYRRYAIVDNAMLQDAVIRLGQHHASEAKASNGPVEISESYLKVRPLKGTAS